MATILYTPLPLASFGRAILQAEAELNPRWADYISPDHTTDFDVDTNIREARAAKFILANSELTKESYVPITDSIVKVPLSVDLRRIGELGLLGEAMKIHRRDRSPLKIIFSGRIHQRKGLSYLFQAISDVGCSTIDLTLVGADDLGMLRALRAAYPEVKFKHLPPMPQPDLWKELSLNHVFVLPSLLEGLSSSLAEASAVGLPSIATARSGGLDLYPDGDSSIVIVSPGSASEIAAALRRLYESEDTRKSYAERTARLALSGGWDSYGEKAVYAIRNSLGW